MMCLFFTLSIIFNLPIMSNTNSRAVSLKSTSSYHHRKTVLSTSSSSNNSHKIITTNKKKRPSTWTCHQRLSLNQRYTISPRVSKCCSQHYKKTRQEIRSTKASSNTDTISIFYSAEDCNGPHDEEEDQHQFDTKRQTMATISTNTNSDATTLNHPTAANALVYNSPSSPFEAVFHAQSILFLFGFLFFPCWWIGGYYLKAEAPNQQQPTLAAIAAQGQDQSQKDILLNAEEKQMMMTVHPSLLANGKTSSRSFWVPPPPSSTGPLTLQQDTKPLFHKWNRVMSLVSVGLSICIVALLIWYFVAYQ